jgi:hypothetical protein
MSANIISFHQPWCLGGEPRLQKEMFFPNEPNLMPFQGQGPKNQAKSR